MRRPRGARLLSAVLAAAALVGACTTGAAPRRPALPGAATPGGSTGGVPRAPQPGRERAVVLDVVADRSPGSDDRSYLEGMELAVGAVNARGGVRGLPLRLVFHDHGGDPARAARVLAGLARAGARGLLYVGPGGALLRAREALLEAGTPVVLLEGDLYTGRQLFFPVFQTSVPWAWQAHELARYLVRDRRVRRVGFVGVGAQARLGATVLRQALRYWGGDLARWAAVPAAASGPGASQAAEALDAAAARAAEAVVRGLALAGSAPAALVVLGPPGPAAAAARAAGELASGEGRPLRVVAGASLLAAPEEGVAPGTAAVYVHTWAGWAEPIPRVHRFRRAFLRATGRLPTGFEQEGYDAVRVLAWGLERSGLRGGRRLALALEGARDLVFSGFPVDLGPDDHLFAPRDELGLFALPGPRERLDPWQRRGGPRWRPIMRTFTYDGHRTNVPERDRRAFFPGWRKGRPAPPFWRSRYGITTRPRADPLH